MGAGSQEKHHIQDAAEVYVVYRLQQLAVNNDCAINNDVKEKYQEFLNYCKDRNLSVDTLSLSYKSIRCARTFLIAAALSMGFKSIYTSSTISDGVLEIFEIEFKICFDKFQV